MRKLPSVVFLKHDASSKKILENLLKFLLSQALWELNHLNEYTNNHFLRPLTTSLQLLGERLDSLPILIKESLKKSIEFNEVVLSFQDLLNKSHDGKWCDPYNDPEVMEKVNLDKLKISFKSY